MRLGKSVVARHSEGSPAKPVVVGGLALILLFAVAWASNRASGRLTATATSAPIPNLLGDLFVAAEVCGLILAVLVSLAIWDALKPQRRERHKIQQTFHVPWTFKVLALFFLFATTGGALTLLVILARNGNGVTAVQDEPPQVLGTGGSSGNVLQAPNVYGPPVSFHWWLILSITAAAVGAWTLYIILSKRAGPTREPLQAPKPHDQIRVAVEASLRELLEAADVRTSIIRAYVTLERMLAQGGLGRLPYEATLENLLRVSATVSINQPAAKRLTELFLHARFGNHPLDATSRDQAYAALDAIRRGLEWSELPT